MSLASAQDQATSAINDVTPSEAGSALLEHAIGVGFLLVALVAMTGWLYLLGVALWDGASWLLS
jgi:hypothetical protein